MNVLVCEVRQLSMTFAVWNVTSEFKPEEGHDFKMGTLIEEVRFEHHSESIQNGEHKEAALAAELIKRHDILLMGFSRLMGPECDIKKNSI